LLRFSLAFHGIPGTIPTDAGTADRCFIRMRARSRARLGEAASPAIASHKRPLRVTVRLLNATKHPVADSKILTTTGYRSRRPTGAGAAVRGCRDDGREHAHTRSVTDVPNPSAFRNYRRLPSSEP